MKKTLLALAALTAFAGTASAQSSVTLFGVVDVNVRYIMNDDNMTTLSQDGIASSRLGFRGTEDLGGGLKAGFWLEGALGPDTGTAAGQSWQRRSTVSLMGNWGEIRMGRDYTPQFWNWTIFDVFGTNGVGASTNLALEGGRNAGTAGTYGTLVRANNSVGYFLPAMGGFYGQAMVAAGEGVSGNKHAGLRLGYAAGPFDVAFAYGETQVNAADDNANEWNIGGAWNFGAFKVVGYYGEIDVLNVTQKNWNIGGQWATGAWTWKASYGSVDNVFVTQVSNVDANQWALGVVYDLSKRTSLYSTYSSISNNGTSFRVAGTPATGPTLSVGHNSSGFEFGVKHAF
jgi:predicted porin